MNFKLLRLRKNTNEFVEETLISSFYLHMRAYSILSNSGETIRDFTLGALKAGGEDLSLNTYKIPKRFQYNTLAYKNGELFGHFTMSVIGILGTIIGSGMEGAGVVAAPVTGGVSLEVTAGGVVVETYSVGLEATASTNFAKTSLEKKAMKSEGSSSSSGEIINEDLGAINEEQQIKDNFDNLTDKEKEVFGKYEKNGWIGQYGKNGPTNAGARFENDGRFGGEILPEYEADGVTKIRYKEFDINKADPVTNFRDNKRFVRGSDGSIYYTDDHYMTFRRIK